MQIQFTISRIDPCFHQQMMENDEFKKKKRTKELSKNKKVDKNLFLKIYLTFLIIFYLFFFRFVNLVALWVGTLNKLAGMMLQ